MTIDFGEAPSGGADSVPHRLPLSEPVGRHKGMIGEDVIQTVVDAFYEAIRHDDVVGHIFTERISDWPRHLAKMCDFWSTIVLRSGRYAGRPLEVHMQIPHLADEHFSRWLELWDATIEQHVPGHARSYFTVPAIRMARTMAQRCINQATAGVDETGLR